MTMHPRHEARLAAIVGLRWIGVGSTFAPMLDWANQFAKDPAHVVTLSGAAEDDPSPTAERHTGNMELAHLLQTFGLHEYEPARALARQMVPRNAIYSPEARAAGIWALSRYYEDQPDQALAGQLVARLNDVFGMDPEMDMVRRLAALAVGSMRAKGFEDTILYHYETYTGSQLRVQQTCHWALERITGDSYEPIQPHERNSTGWFMEPIENVP
jgi:hypothetical protein